MITLPEMPSFELTGKKALITGGSRGIGLACATALAQAGAKVTLLARCEKQLISAVTALREQNLAADFKSFDLNNMPPVLSWLEQHDPFDILINNAGINFPKNLVDMDLELIEQIINTNLIAVIKLTREWSKIAIANNKPGVVINISSQFGKVGAAGRAVYSASKHAIEGLTKSLAWELGPHKIRVNNICPTFIATEMTKKTMAHPNFENDFLAKTALRKVGEPKDIMGAALFLASPAASMITGSSIVVDGGWTAQ